MTVDAEGPTRRDPGEQSRVRELVPAEVELQLEVLEARRRRLHVVGGIAAIGAAGIAALVLVVDQVDLPWWAGWALLATTALFVADAALQERTLADLTRRFVAHRERTAELEAAVGDLGALLSTARRINRVLLPEEVYDVVLDAAVELLEADSGSLRLRVGDALAVAASTGPDAPPVGSAVPVDQDPAVVVLSLGVEVVEDDPPRLALPITVGGRHVGVLKVRRQNGRFTRRAALLASLLAEEAATAAVNANRFDVERSRAEELRSDREVRTDAVADTVHDLRAPLSGLVAYAELLRERFDQLDEDRRREAVDGVWVSADRLRRLIDQVFDVASAEAQAVRVREPVELVPLVRSVAVAAEAAEIDWGVEAATRAGTTEPRVLVVADAEPVVLADPESLRRVLTNLVHNALEHGSPAVRMRVQVRRREALVHVADRGAGMSEAELETLFERHRRDGSPRGRGLVIVDLLVRAMGGRVGVRSRPGVGSVFTVALPLPADDETD